MIPNPAYGAPFALAVAAIVLLSILPLRVLKGFLSNLAVLIGIGIGFAVAIAAGKVDFHGVADADWVRIIHPLAFGWPIFEFWSIFSLCAVMTVMMIESTGQFLAVGDMAGRKITQAELTRGLEPTVSATLSVGCSTPSPTRPMRKMSACCRSPACSVDGWWRRVVSS